jgi:hypothetical protein
MERRLRCTQTRRFPAATAGSRGPVSSIEGEVGLHQYLILKQESHRLFIHANNYQDRQSTFTVRARDPRLEVQAEPARALVRRTASNDGRTVTLTVSHGHEQSVVRVFAK